MLDRPGLLDWVRTCIPYCVAVQDNCHALHNWEQSFIPISVKHAASMGFTTDWHCKHQASSTVSATDNPRLPRTSIYAVCDCLKIRLHNPHLTCTPMYHVQTLHHTEHCVL